MADIFDKQKRREIMAAVKQKNSKMEVLVFSHLNRQKIYFQRHYRKAVGTPDIALPRKKKAIFIDGDFWHGRTLAQLEERKGPNDFWVIKIRGNVERDSRQHTLLKEQGWRVLRIWESDLRRMRTRDDTLKVIVDFLSEPVD